MREDSSTAYRWLQVSLDKSARGNLVKQIVEEFDKQLAGGAIKPGDKLPSVRYLSKFWQVSTFTVVESYERLIAAGRIVSRRGAGYFVESRQPKVVAPDPNNMARGGEFSLHTFAADRYQSNASVLPAGAGWLPADWHGEGLIQEAARRALRIHPNKLVGYGNVYGLPELRQILAQRVCKHLMDADESNVLLTRSATHAFDLILRTLTRPGDRVLIESPGYLNMSALVSQNGCVPVAVNRSCTGLDMEQVDRLAVEHRPKLAFINTVLQNPLGTTLSTVQCHQLLRLAEQHDFLIVEDDIFREFAEPQDASLAAMDGLCRVIRVDSTSKTLSPFLRVGSIYADDARITAIAGVKMKTGLTSSELDERVALEVLTSTEYRRCVSRLHHRLESAQASAPRQLKELGLAAMTAPSAGMFICASMVDPALSAPAIARRAKTAGLLLWPGELFTAGKPANAWFRFNVAYLGHPKLANFFSRLG